MKNWREYKLGDLIDVKHVFAFKGNSITENLTNNILVTPGNFQIGGGFKNLKFKYYNDTFLEEYILKENDVVVTMTDLSQETDTLGYPAKIPAKKDARFLHNQRIGLIQFKSNEANRDFIYWVMRTRDYQGFIIGSASGTSIMHTAPTRIKEYSFLLPSLPEQTTIAETLNSLDDKIGLLQRQNKTLEELANIFFKKWFIEDENKNWVEKGLDQVAEFLNGLACQKYPVKHYEIGLPVIKIKEMRTGITVASDRATSDIPEKYLVQDGDILFSWSGSLDIIIWSGGNGVLNQHLFKVSSTEFPQWFNYFWIKYHLPEFQAIAEDKATTMGHIQRHHLSNAMVKVPSKNELKNMDKTICPIFQKIKSNALQIKTLTHLRETLLPKLMSGEVRVKY